MEYQKEKLYEIVRYLATAEGDMRDRLKNMAVEISLISSNDLPKDLQAKWEFVEKSLSKHPAKFNWNGTRQEMGSIESSLSRMKNRTACKIANEIFELWEELNYR